MPPDRRDEVREALVAVVPAAIAVIPFGLLLGALAAQKGLSPLEVALMSATVFAGSAQFIAIDIWTEPAPWLLLTVTALLINLRHLLMGASLAPKIRSFGTGPSLLALFTMVDETWALCEQRSARKQVTFSYMVTMGAVLWVNWVAFTTLGAGIGALIGDPSSYGFDFAFSALFLTLIVGLWRGSRTGVAIAASAVVAVIFHLLFDGPWYIAAGGVAGAIAGAIYGPRHEAATEAAQ
ncbi:AzlC family ABC transporter permease [Microbaculum marinum]|uniref:AzlC family ABC transporter permease n=1 Tax=Microbaculum marinum TaxID=1764581 RepID=A0AAW9RU70_9HYPH